MWVVQLTIYGFYYSFTHFHSSSRTPTAFWICLHIAMLYWPLSPSFQGSCKPFSVLNEHIFLSHILSIGIILVFHFYSPYSKKAMPAPSRQTKGTSFFSLSFQHVTSSSSCGCSNYATEASKKKGRASYGCR